MSLCLRGFALVELMVALVIVGVLFALALPAFNGYVIRSRVAEGLGLAMSAKTAVADGVFVLNEIVASANAFNAQVGGAGLVSKYVASIQINTQAGEHLGEITIQFDDGRLGGVGVSEPTLVLAPFVRGGGGVAPLGMNVGSDPAQSGILDWVCVSASDRVASQHGYNGITLGSLPPEFSPASCR